ncbi:hypothetical protein KHQ81_10150 [Mycoplasmatota bacterium]|nr:hypothetical protein KHQ81_10150 [Mycoplasmatota bacterium]
MYCRNCGSEVESINEPCTKCGFLPLNGTDYCQECGFTTNANQFICTSCQQRLKFAPSPSSQTYHTEHKTVKQTKHYQDVEDYLELDQPNVVANIAACCTVPFSGPIVGLVLYLVWKDEKPNAANSVCMWTLIPFIGIIIFYLFFFMIGGFTQIFR